MEFGNVMYNNQFNGKDHFLLGSWLETYRSGIALEMGKTAPYGIACRWIPFREREGVRKPISNIFNPNFKIKDL